MHSEQPVQWFTSAAFRKVAVEWSCTTDTLFTPPGEIIILRVGGEIDLVTLPLLEAALDAHLDQHPEHLLVDLTWVTYCCARGMDLLVATAARAADQAVGYAVSGLPIWLDRIWRILFNAELPVRYHSVAAAVAAIQMPRQARASADPLVRRAHLRGLPTPARHEQRDDRMIRVLVVDDHAFLRDSIAALLATAADIAVVGRCASGAEALAVAPAVNPDVVLMDISMPVLDGVETTRRLRETWPGARVLILTASLDGTTVPDAYQAGAVGCQLKSADPDELIEAVRTVHAGREAWDKHAIATLRRWTVPAIRPNQELPL